MQVEKEAKTLIENAKQNIEIQEGILEMARKKIKEEN